MKKIKVILLYALITLLGGSSALYAQKTADEIRQLVESKNFVFKAESANPVSGGTRQLSPGYDLTVTNSSIVSYLPFYGRAQTIPIGNDGGIKFTSTNFDYSAAAGRKGKGWQVTLKTKDVSHVQLMYLTIYDNGNATLDVMNIHRDNISFRGYISDVK
jgi:hypothetical protein